MKRPQAGSEPSTATASVRSSARPAARIAARGALALRAGVGRSGARLRGGWNTVTGAITGSGWFVLLAGATALVLALTLGWVEAALIAVVAAVLLGTALPFLAGGRAQQMSLSLERTRVVVGGEVLAWLTVTQPGAAPSLPATAEVPVGAALMEVRIPLIEPRGSVRIPLPVHPGERGLLEIGPVTVTRRDPLRLLRREVTWREAAQLIVHPVTVGLPPTSTGLVRDLEGAASEHLTDADLSFHAVREYARGDAVRHIHWKSTAKTGTLMVRQYQESQLARVALLCDTQPEAYGSPEEFELGVSAAASLSLQAVRDGRERSVWAVSSQDHEPALRQLPAHTPTLLMDAWARVRPPRTKRTLESQARELAGAQRDLSTVLLVTGAEPSLRQLRRTALAFPANVSVQVVRCSLDAVPEAHRFGNVTVLTLGALTDLRQLVSRGAEQ